MRRILRQEKGKEGGMTRDARDWEGIKGKGKRREKMDKEEMGRGNDKR